MSVVLTALGVAAMIAAMAALMGVSVCLSLRLAKKAENDKQEGKPVRFPYGGGFYHPYL